MTEQVASRINISLPAGLKDQMEAAGGEINWSAVAAEAFRAKLLEWRSGQPATSLAAAADRLRALAERRAKEDYAAGLAAGEEWAKTRAAPWELERLDKAFAEDDLGEFLTRALTANRIGMSGPAGVMIELGEVIEGSELDAETAAILWEKILGDAAERIEEEEFAAGFVEGALDVWNKVSAGVATTPPAVEDAAGQDQPRNPDTNAAKRTADLLALKASVEHAVLSVRERRAARFANG